eukprot:gb/GEZN01011970.1/.p1 GENE.gb/GEZN01011970.1/~~gb/GEZN01011970.1/.p1  ORF type:complete len:232 (+),score=15.52 gb/GEZN01011970.1/:33-728(+)
MPTKTSPSDGMDTPMVVISQATPEEFEHLSIGTVKATPLGANQRCVSLVLLFFGLVMFMFATRGTQWVRATGGNAAGREQCRFGLFKTCDCIRVGQDNAELPCMAMNRRLDAAFEEDDDVYNDFNDDVYITRGFAVVTCVLSGLTLAFSAWEKADTAIKPRPINFKRIKLVAALMFICAMIGVATTRRWQINPRIATGIVNGSWAWGKDYELFRAGWIMLLVAVPIAQFLE